MEQWLELLSESTVSSNWWVSNRENSFNLFIPTGLITGMLTFDCTAAQGVQNVVLFASYFLHNLQTYSKNYWDFQFKCKKHADLGSTKVAIPNNLSKHNTADSWMLPMGTQKQGLTILLKIASSPAILEPQKNAH